VPTNMDKEGLATLLQRHLDLQRPSNDTSDNIGDIGGRSDGGNDNGAWVHTMAPDPRRDQVATVRFRHVPTRLRTLERSDQITINVTSFVNKHASSNQGPSSAPTVKLVIDRHFNGITVLFSPPSNEHNINVLAVPGLGGHPFGSFVHKGDGHMWLSDNLPRDMPTARVMIYGYESGLHNSTSFAALDDLAGSLRLDICRLLRSGEQKSLVLVGHSLGGLLIKVALVQMAESDSELDLVCRIFGGLFFGVPNDGMDIESLIPMVSDQPNRLLLESLNAMNSQVLGLQRTNFAKFLGKTAFELFCFYETRLSPTAAWVSGRSEPDYQLVQCLISCQNPGTGRYEMKGTPRCLVTTASATSCLLPGSSSDHSAELPRTHSELVKFAAHDSDYDKVSYVLSRMYQSCTGASSTGQGKLR